jgi:hypothetical protein
LATCRPKAAFSVTYSRLPQIPKYIWTLSDRIL